MSSEELLKKSLNYFQNNELAAKVWLDKYRADGESTPDDMHRRLADEFARIEYQYFNKMCNNPSSIKDNLSPIGQSVVSVFCRYTKKELSNAIYQQFNNFAKIIPGGSVMSTLGVSPYCSLSNCFVLKAPYDSYSSINRTREEQCNLMKRRGGVGKDLSNIRPKGAKVANSANTATGVVSFMHIDSELTRETAQNGRRGALMLTLDLRHPDSPEFINSKEDITKITGANISLKISDDFMRAVEAERYYLLRYPCDVTLDEAKEIINEQLGVRWDNLEMNKVYHLSCKKYPVFSVRLVDAKELKLRIDTSAYKSAEPGVMFANRMWSYAPDGVYPNYRFVSSNPCGK